MNASSSDHAQNYDVYFSVAGGSRFFLRNPNHGISVGDGGMSWTADQCANDAAFAEIAAIHLQIAALGNAQNTIDQCIIQFAGKPALTVTNAGASGLPSTAQTPIYRDFVCGLHARLAAHAHDQIRFTAGMAQWRYRTLIVTMVVAVLFFVVTPLGLAIFTGDLHGLALMLGGAFLCWPVILLLRKNTPRTYTPDRLPDEMLS